LNQPARRISLQRASELDPADGPRVGIPASLRHHAQDALLDHLVRPQQQRRRDGEAEGVRGPEVQREVQLHRTLDRKLSNLCPLEDLVDVARGTAEQIDDIWAIADEPPCFGKLRENANGRQTVLKREIGKIS